MTKKRKDDRKPKRLQDFFSNRQREGRQDGAEASSPHAEETSTRPHKQGLKPHHCGTDAAQQSPSSTPVSGSPAKAKPRLDDSRSNMSESPVSASGDDTQEIPESIELFPTLNQPVSDTVLKDMLISLRSTLQADMASHMSRINHDIHEVERRVDHIETKMGEYASTINDLVDANNEREDDSEWLKAKMADMEDRSRRNNLKIRGIPESIQQPDLRSYATTLFQALLPGLSDLDVTIDRIHRLPKPSHLPDQIPRDVILRLHFFHIKDNLMVVMRKQEQVPPQYQKLQFYTDLSQYTLQKRKNLNTVTKMLRNHQINYRWGYPTKLTIFKDGHSYIINTLEKGLSILKEWGILPTPSDENSTAAPRQVNSDWKKVNGRNARNHI